MQTALLLMIVIIGWGLSHNFWRLSAKTTPPAAIPIIGLICGLCLTPLYLWVLNKNSLSTKWNWQGISWAALGYIVSALGTLAYMFVLQKNDVSRVVGISTSYPILTMMVAIMFMGETFSLAKFIGLLLVLTGVMVATRG